MNKKDLILFDVDGTIAESTQKVGPEMANLLFTLSKAGYELGIVGGSSYSKIIDQLEPISKLEASPLNHPIITHIFSENGCVYHKNNILQSKVNIREHHLYPQMNKLVKKALEYLSTVPYTISGQFIDLRNGIIYVSLIGGQATLEERKYFMQLDKIHGFRKILLKQLQDLGKELGITNHIAILEGGSVGIGIHPVEYDKVQVAESLRPSCDSTVSREYSIGTSLDHTFNSISYFGDKYLPEGNDYKLLHHEIIRGFKVDSVSDTISLLRKNFLVPTNDMLSGQ